MRHIIAQMMGVVVEFKIFGNRVWIQSNNEMVKQQFIKFLDTKGKEIAAEQGGELPMIETDERTQWVKVTLPYEDNETSENLITDKFKIDLEKSGLGVKELK